MLQWIHQHIWLINSNSRFQDSLFIPSSNIWFWQLLKRWNWCFLDLMFSCVKLNSNCFVPHNGELDLDVEALKKLVSHYPWQTAIVIKLGTAEAKNIWKVRIYSLVIRKGLILLQSFINAHKGVFNWSTHNPFIAIFHAALSLEIQDHPEH